MQMRAITANMRELIATEALYTEDAEISSEVKRVSNEGVSFLGVNGFRT